MAVVISVIGKSDMKAISKAQKELDGLKSSAVKNAGGIKGAMSSFSGAISSGWAKAASGMAAFGLASWLKGSIGIARDAEASQKSLANTVTDAGGNWRALSGGIKTAIASAASMSGYSKGELRGGLEQVITTTGKVTDSQRLLGVAMDLARRKHLSVASASILVGRAYNGNTTALKRMGIELPKGAKGLDAVNALQKRVAGSAKTFGDSSAGSEAKFKNSITALQTALGTALLPAVNLAERAVTKLVSWFTRAPKPIQDILIGIGGFATVGLLIAPFISSIITVVGVLKSAQIATKLMTAGQWLLNAAMDANPVGLVVLAIAALIAVGVLLWKHWGAISAWLTSAWHTLSAVAGKAFAAIGKAIAAPFLWLYNHNTYVKAFVDGAVAAFNRFKSIVGSVAGAVATTFHNVVSSVGGFIGKVASKAAGIASAIASPIVNLAKKAFGWGANLLDMLINGLKSKANKIASAVKGVAKTIAGFLGFHSPAKEGPGSDADTWAPNLIRMYAAGLRSSMPLLRTQMSAVAGLLNPVGSLAFSGVPSAVSALGGSASSGPYPTASTTIIPSPVRSVVISEGAVQVTFPAGTSASKSEIETTISRALKQLVDQIARR